MTTSRAHLRGNITPASGTDDFHLHIANGAGDSLTQRAVLVRSATLDEMYAQRVCDQRYVEYTGAIVLGAE